jgi:sugar transferase (PEP-CTERM/EpsH1 system associated)
MRILFFSPRSFWPPDTGAKLRDYHLARQLAAHADVTYLGFSEAGADGGEGAAAAGSVFERVELVPRDPGYTPLKLARGVVGRVPVTVLNYTTGRMKQAFARLLAEGSYDAVQLESVHLAEYVKLIWQAPGRRPRIISDWHNIESELMRRYSEQSMRLVKRLYARATARRLEWSERELSACCDLICVTSEREREYVMGWAPRCPIEVIENGVDTAHYAPEEIDAASRLEFGSVPPGRQSLVYVGSMDYHANVDAVTQFAHTIWPAVHAAFPDLVFKIVGRNPGPQVTALTSLPQVVVTGSVEDVRPYYREALASVVPLRVGGGTRLKILEAMAAGTPVVSTALGAEGLAISPGRDILLAETAEEFLSAIRQLKTSKASWNDLVAGGRQLARSRYDWTAIGQTLFDCHGRLAGREAAPVRDLTVR